MYVRLNTTWFKILYFMPTCKEIKYYTIFSYNFVKTVYNCIYKINISLCWKMNVYRFIIDQIYSFLYSEILLKTFLKHWINTNHKTKIIVPNNSSEQNPQWKISINLNNSSSWITWPDAELWPSSGTPWIFFSLHFWHIGTLW